MEGVDILERGLGLEDQWDYIKDRGSEK